MYVRELTKEELEFCLYLQDMYNKRYIFRFNGSLIDIYFIWRSCEKTSETYNHMISQIMTDMLYLDEGGVL